MSELERMDNDIVKLSMHIPADTFKAAVEKVYHKTASRFSVPGWRKGKAPKKMIETYYGPMVFFDDAFDSCWADVYEAAVKEHNIQPVDRPSVEISSVSEQTGVDFTAEVQLTPTVTLGEYKGVEVIRREAAVSDEEVNAALEAEQQKQTRFTDVERPVQNGDRIVLDYEGTVDGVAFEGGTAEDQNLDIGSGTFIPGFEEQLVGAVAGEDRDVNVTFPEEYHAKELAGKAAVFACKVKAVQEKQIPEVDDEFIKDISEFDTVDEWKDHTKAEMLKNRQESVRRSMENDAVEKAVNNAECLVPDCMTERQVNYMMQDFAYQLQSSGISMEDYLKYCGTNAEKMKEMYKPDASARVKTDLVLAKIKEDEGITAADEEIEKEIGQFAEQNGMKLEDLQKNLSEDDKAYFADRICIRKTVEFLLNNAVLVEAPAAEPQEPEKTETAE